MPEHPCIRCQHPVLLDEGHLVYCGHCGAPQIFLGEDLQQEMEENARGYFERTAAAEASASAEQNVPARPARKHPLQSRSGESAWTLAIRCALASAAIALGLGLLSLALPPVGLLLIFWVLGAPMLTVAFFLRQQKGLAPASGSALPARLGLLTGFLLVACCATVFTLSLVLSRFVFHDASALDAQMAANFAQQRAVLISRMGTEIQPTLELFSRPEYRVGLLLSALSTGALVYLLLSTLAASVTGLLVRRRG